MPRKSMVEEYKTSNSTGTGPRTTGNGYTILKGSILFSYSGKKGEYGTLVRMMIDIRMTNGIRIQQRNLTYRNLRSLIEKLEGLCWMLQEWTDYTICVIFMICAVSMNGYYPSFTSSWTESHRKMKFSLSCLNRKRYEFHGKINAAWRAFCLA